jgi:Arc/MetJ-type ribon-helix-helix transcriptional regulator
MADLGAAGTERGSIKGRMASRTKVSVSLPTELVTLVDRGVRSRRFLSRSAAIEEALRGLERSQRDREIEAYYAGRTEAERDEERAWGEVGAEALATSTRAAEARAAYGVRRGGPRRAAPGKKR